MPAEPETHVRITSDTTVRVSFALAALFVLIALLLGFAFGPVVTREHVLGVGLACGAAVVCVVVGVKQVLIVRRLRDHGVRVVARVTAVRRTRRPILWVEFDWEGARVPLRMSLPTRAARNFEKGSELTLLIDPSDPRRYAVLT